MDQHATRLTAIAVDLVQIESPSAIATTRYAGVVAMTGIGFAQETNDLRLGESRLHRFDLLLGLIERQTAALLIPGGSTHV